MKTVFLSHSSEDKAMVWKLARSLESHGISSWVDEAEINIGDSLFQKIADAIEDIDFVIAVISSSSVKSKWVQKELQLAMTKEILNEQVVVLPLVLDSCTIPFFISDKCFADFRESNKYETSVNKLAKSILRNSDVNGSHNKPATDSQLVNKVSHTDVGQVVYPYSNELYAVRANERQNRYSESFLLLGFFIMLLSFLIKLFSSFSAGLYMLLGGCAVIMAGVFLKLAFIKNKEAYRRSPNLILEIENIRGWNLPFGRKWQLQYEISATSNDYRRGLMLETGAVLILHLSTLFFAMTVLAML